MTAFSDDLETKLFNATLRNTAYTSPVTVYLALFTSDPTDAYTVANEVDTTVDDTAYVRQSIAFGAPTNGVGSNSAQITFPAVVYGTGGLPYNVTHIGITDSATYQGGNLLYHVALDASVSQVAGKSLIFEIGSVVITLA